MMLRIYELNFTTMKHEPIVDFSLKGEKLQAKWINRTHWLKNSLENFGYMTAEGRITMSEDKRFFDRLHTLGAYGSSIWTKEME